MIELLSPKVCIQRETHKNIKATFFRCSNMAANIKNRTYFNQFLSRSLSLACVTSRATDYFGTLSLCSVSRRSIDHLNLKVGIVKLLLTIYSSRCMPKASLAVMSCALCFSRSKWAPLMRKCYLKDGN